MTLAPPLADRRLTGIVLIVVAYCCFAVIDSSAKWLGLAGLPIMQVVFLRYAGSLFAVGAFYLPKQGIALIKTRSFRTELLRAGALLGSSVCNLTAVQYLPLTVTSSIAFTMPLILCALSIPMLSEHVGPRRWTAIAVGFVGVLVIAAPGSSAFHPAALLSLAGATFSALYFLWTRKLAGIDSTATQQFYGSLTATIVLAPPALLNWVWPTQSVDWYVCAVIGLAGFVGHQLSTSAHRFAPASSLAPFAYFQIVIMALSGWLVFQQQPDANLYAGAPIVIASGLYLWFRERELSNPP